jgi:hypothetical protein
VLDGDARSWSVFSALRLAGDIIALHHPYPRYQDGRENDEQHRGRSGGREQILGWLPAEAERRDPRQPPEHPRLGGEQGRLD